ncbi:MAG: sensor histidine kinase [Bacteroidota bacterium]
MKGIFDRIPFKLINYVYWLLLIYLVAALGWWYIELDHQNDQMLAFQREHILKGNGSSLTLEQAVDAHDRNAKQFLGEGLTFLIFTILGAIFVYGAVRRQIRYHLQQKNFMLAVTHELKTPIAVTKLSLETLKRHQLPQEKQEKLLSDALNEAERLDMLCNNILLSSQMDAGGYESIKQEFDCSIALSASVTSFSKRYPDRSIQANIPSGTMVYGEELLLRLVFNNLIENAIKYTPANAPIAISLTPLQDAIQIQVADGGPGIPDALKQKVFEKFYRLEDERTRKTKGTGLGLYLSARIIQNHKGMIRVEDNQPNGCIFNITLPKLTAE